MQPWRFNIRHIRAFVKTFELGSLRAASKSVHMSQPAMSQAISKLEEQLDMQLFRRQSDGMKPTRGADLLHPRLKAFLAFVRSVRVTHAQIRAFLALARSGSYAAAHQRSGLARASLHRAVSDLEGALGQSLVRRRGRGLELTDAGCAYARRYSLAEAELRSALEEVRALRGLNAGRVAVGAMPLCRARVLPEVIVRFQKFWPTCDIYVAEGSHAELLEPLRNGELDILIGALREDMTAPDLLQVPLFGDWPVVIARYAHPLQTHTSHTLESLSAYDWCLPPRGVPLRDRWEQMFGNVGLTAPNVRVECGSVITIRQILMQTDCLTILSPDQVAVELEAGWVKIVGKTTRNMQRTIGMTYRENWRPTRPQRGLMNMLGEVARGQDSLNPVCDDGRDADSGEAGCGQHLSNRLQPGAGSVFKS
ncbi:MAG: LysR family transcriptional regulator [Hyphomonadaceae bacterium]|nr:LysR family transcriptional regulator [Hyphomonadaceae bacterium]